MNRIEYQSNNQANQLSQSHSEPEFLRSFARATDTQTEIESIETYGEIEAQACVAALEPELPTQEVIRDTFDTAATSPIQWPSDMASAQNPDQCIFFETTPSAQVQMPYWYLVGKVFQIQDRENRHINDRAMIVLAHTSYDSVICVALCAHSNDNNIDQQPFDKTHAKIYASNSASGGSNGFGIDLAPNSTLSEDAFVNLAHPFTIKRAEVKVRNCGMVVRGQIQDLLEKHAKVYAEVLRIRGTLL